MAWNPNEEGNYAWLSTIAHKHGGVKELLSSIENNAFNKGLEQGVQNGFIKGARFASPIVFIIGATIGIFIDRKIKDKKTEKRKEMQEKSDIAKEIIINEFQKNNQDIIDKDDDNDNKSDETAE